MLLGLWIISSNNHSINNKCKIWTACSVVWAWVVQHRFSIKLPLLKMLLVSWTIKLLQLRTSLLQCSNMPLSQIHLVWWVKVIHNKIRKRICSVEWICKLTKLRWFNQSALQVSKYKNQWRNKNLWISFQVCLTLAVMLWGNKLLIKKKVICYWLHKAIVLRFKWVWIQWLANSNHLVVSNQVLIQCFNSSKWACLISKIWCKWTRCNSNKEWWWCNNKTCSNKTWWEATHSRCKTTWEEAWVKWLVECNNKWHLNNNKWWCNSRWCSNKWWCRTITTHWEWCPIRIRIKDFDHA